MGKSNSSGNAKLVATIALAMGVMSFDQGSVGYLLPFIKPDLRLSDTEIGAIASTYWVTFAIASYAIGILASARGVAKRYLIAMLILFGLCAFLSGFVKDSGSLLFARAAMGTLAGALLTLGQSVLGLSSPPDKVGTNMGLVTGLGGSLSGLVVAPVVLVHIATAFGWRAGYFAITLPAWLAALLVFLNIPKFGGRDTKAIAVGNKAAGIVSGLREVVRHRNIVLCTLLCSLYVAYLGLGLTFLPIYFVSVRGFSPTQMSALIVVLGLSSILFAIALPVISNRFGRKPILAVACITSVLAPLAAYYFEGPAIILAALLFLGWSMSGTGTFSMGIIPSETVSGDVLSRALGSVIAFGVLLGGLAGPTIAGWSADRWGGGAPLLVQAACAAIAGLTAMALHETAPQVLARHRAGGQALAGGEQFVPAVPVRKVP
jgi:predicted MFS family arabinose efflux permease